MANLVTTWCTVTLSTVITGSFDTSKQVLAGQHVSCLISNKLNVTFLTLLDIATIS